MKIVLPAAAFPPPDYIALIITSGEVMIEHHEHYVRQTLRNRYLIATSNGALTLSVPVHQSRKNHVPFDQIKIDYRTRWQVSHRRAWDAAYSKSPYYEHYLHHFLPHFHCRVEKLSEFDSEVLKTCLGILRLDKLPGHTLAYETRDFYDLDFRSWPKHGFGTAESYPQVFEERHGFLSDMCFPDLIFNLGPDAKAYLMRRALRLSDILFSDGRHSSACT